MTLTRINRALDSRRTRLRKHVRRVVERLRYASIQKPTYYKVGSAKWLCAVEKHFGGKVMNVKRNVVSPYDRRPTERIAQGGMVGGDRMFHHGYAEAYARHLAPMVEQRFEDLTIVEVGILKGTGLALWSWLFPNACIIGLDIDVGHFLQNAETLRRLGAFSRRSPIVEVFDQHVDGTDRLREICGERAVNLVIDDGVHRLDVATRMAGAFRPLLARDFAYFVEDIRHGARAFHRGFDDCRIVSYGKIAVATCGRTPRDSLPHG